MELQHWLLLGGLFWAIVWGGVGVYVAQQKGRSDNEGLWFGALLGPIGVLLVAMLPPLAAKTTAPVEVYQFKPRKMLGPVREERQA